MRAGSKEDLAARSLTRTQRQLKSAQISPLMEAVPPKLYGGTERIVSYLTDVLTSLGHDVTLFAGGERRYRTDPLPASLCPASVVGGQRIRAARRNARYIVSARASTHQLRPAGRAGMAR
jgi:hypothetical protein